MARGTDAIAGARHRPALTGPLHPDSPRPSLVRVTALNSVRLLAKWPPIVAGRFSSWRLDGM